MTNSIAIAGIARNIFFITCLVHWCLSGLFIISIVTSKLFPHFQCRRYVCFACVSSPSAVIKGIDMCAMMQVLAQKRQSISPHSSYGIPFFHTSCRNKLHRNKLKIEIQIYRTYKNLSQKLSDSLLSMSSIWSPPPYL